MTWGFFLSPEMAEGGHALVHIMHPVHIEASIANAVIARHTPAGHFLSWMWASYSARKFAIVLKTGFGADLPSPHSAEIRTFSASRAILSRSPSFPSPFVIFDTSAWSWKSPSRHGTHLPHDSSSRNSRK